MIKELLSTNLKQAMLSGDKSRVELINMLKSAILYKEVELGVREAGLTNDQIIEVLSKEAKKRQEAADLYGKAGDSEREEKELKEKAIITEYLPEQVSDEVIEAAVDEIISSLKPEGMKDMGKVIGSVKSKLGNQADGSKIALLVKQKLS